MKATFVDTVYWLALLVEEDDYHQRAVEWSQVVSTPLLTTEAILFEVGDALTDPAVRSLAGQFLACAWQDPSLTVVRTDAELYRAPWNFSGIARTSVGV